MRNHFIYGLGALLLCYGCINSQFKKSGTLWKWTF